MFLKEYDCKTTDTTAVFSAGSERILITHTGGGTAAAEPHLPARISCDGADLSPAWELSAAAQQENAFSLQYTDTALHCRYTVFVKANGTGAGPVEISAVFSNDSPREYRVEPGVLLSVNYGFDETPVAWAVKKEGGVAESIHNCCDSDYYKEGPGIYKTEMADGTKTEIETTTNHSWKADDYIPMLYLVGKRRGAYLAVEWPSCRISAAGKQDGVSVTADYREGFSTRIPSGGELTVAPFYVGLYEGDLDDGANLFKRWFFRNKTPKSVLRNENEPLTQIDAQIHPDRCAALGIQSVKWDYGWWSNERVEEHGKSFWRYYEGSWQQRVEWAAVTELRDKGVVTFADYGKYLEEKGLNWTVYVLLHNALKPLEGDDCLTTVGPTAHPDWFSHRTVGYGHVADLGNEECVAYCKRKLASFFSENHIKTWRTDFEPIALASDKKNRHDANGTDVQYWCSRGFYDIVDYLIANVPGFRYESCSAGGGMKDFACLHRATVINNDDSADFRSLRATFYDSSYCIPPAQLQWPTDPACATPESYRFVGIGNPDFLFRSLIMGAVMLGAWCGTENGHIRHGLEKYYGEYLPLHNEKIKPLIRYADLYHVLPRPDQVHWDGLQYGCDWIPENGICGVTAVFRPGDADVTEKTVPVRGLCPDVTYSVEFYEHKEQNCVRTGKDLMDNGLHVFLNKPDDSDLIFYVAREKAGEKRA